MLKRTIASLVLLLSCGEDTVSPPTEAPLQPTHVQAAGSNGQIVVTWADAANESLYRIEYYPSADPTAPLVQEVPANTTSFTHATATRNVSYTYRVTACNSVGCSPASQVMAKWTPPAEAPTITSFTLDSIGFVRADFIAVARSGGVPVSFQFTVTKSGETTPVISNQMVVPPFQDGEPDSPAQANFITNQLQPGTAYVVTVTASNQAGYAGQIAPQTFSTRASMPPTLMNLRNGVAFSTAQPAFRLEVGPNGYNTDYRFELARANESFANPIGTAHFVAQKEWFAWPAWDTGLPTQTQPGVLYKWRVVATNPIGTTVSDSVLYTRQ